MNGYQEDGIINEIDSINQVTIIHTIINLQENLTILDSETIIETPRTQDQTSIIMIRTKL
jgi:hypothetical protein